MDKYIEQSIEWPYERIVLRLNMEPLNKRFVHKDILTQEQWDALTVAERSFYQGQGGTNGWTDVNTIEDSWFVHELWAHCWNCYESADLAFENYSRASQNVLVAKRVCHALALMTFGPEILLR